MPRRALPLSRTSSGIALIDGEAIPYQLIRSPRRRRTMQLSVRAGEGVTVRAPMRTPDRLVTGFIEERATWLRRRLAELAVAVPPVPLTDGVRIRFLGETLALRVEIATEPTVTLEPGVLRAGHPAPSEPAIGDMLTAWFRREAGRLLGECLATWAARMEASPRRVIVKEQHRRWGSCSADGTIRLNWRLVMAPQSLIDLVVVHELAHLARRDHSPVFWAEVRRHIPDLAARRRALREFERARDDQAAI